MASFLTNLSSLSFSSSSSSSPNIVEEGEIGEGEVMDLEEPNTSTQQQQQPPTLSTISSPTTQILNEL